MPGWFIPWEKTGGADGFLTNDSFKLFSEEIVN